MTPQSPISASVHLLGSVSGYCTLACSSDISTVEREALEVLGFGQTDDAEYLESLRTVPAGFGRVLPSGRYALTRCFAGEPDSAGRQTLLFATLVFSSADWINHVCHAAWGILSDSSAWAFRDRDTPDRVSVVAATRSNLGDLRTQIIRAVALLTEAQANGAIAVCADTPTMRAAVAQVASVLPSRDRARVRWGAGVLSAGATVDVCTLPPIAETSGRRRIISFDATPQPSGYAAALAQFWKAGTEPPRAFIDGLSGVADAIPSAGTESQLRHTSESRFVPHGGVAALKIVGLIAIGLAVLAITWFVIGRQRIPLPSPTTAEAAPTLTVPLERDVVAEPVANPSTNSPSRPRISLYQEWEAGCDELKSLRALAVWVEEQLIIGYERKKADALSPASEVPNSVSEKTPRAFEQVPRGVPGPAQAETENPHAKAVPPTPLEKAYKEAVENNVEFHKKHIRVKVAVEMLGEWREAVTKPTPQSADALQVVRAAIKEQKRLYETEFKQRASELRGDRAAVPAPDFNKRVQALSGELSKYRFAIGVDKDSEWVANLQAEVDKLLK